MVHLQRTSLNSSSPRHGFTLIEMLIVAAMITLLSGIAIFAVQQMYDSSRRKTVFGESKEVGSALSFAYQDLGFYPRLNIFNLSKEFISYSDGTQENIRPGFDMYGYLGLGQKVTAIKSQWRGPYMKSFESRASLAQGQKGLCTMRLPDLDILAARQQLQDTYGEDISLARWPTDTWGNPYVLYCVKVDPALIDATTNPKGLRIASLNEQGDFFTAVVSYGRNMVPGCRDVEDREPTPQATIDARKEHAALYVVGDKAGINEADFTLRVAYPQAGSPSLTDQSFLYGPASNGVDSMAGSITSTDPLAPGIIDSGSDDIFWSLP